MTQLYAMIKKNTRYYHQRFYHVDEKGKPVPFEVQIPTEHNGHGGEAKGGAGGNYSIKDLNFYVKVNNNFVRV
jgi:hypothetical protein